MLKHKQLLIAVLAVLILLSGGLRAQETRILQGRVIDLKTGEGLPYVSIFLKNSQSGTISNEQGQFNFRAPIDVSDSLVFQYLGYKNEAIPFPDTDSLLTIQLREEIIQLTELLVYAQVPEPEFIIQKILENRSKNYPLQYIKSPFFIRKRDTYVVKNLDATVKRIDVPGITANHIQQMVEAFPDTIMSYSDNAGMLYRSANPADSVSQKLVVHKSVSLKDKSFDTSLDLIQIFNETLQKNTPGEYWIAKSGLIKIDLEPSTNEKGEIKTQAEELENQQIRLLRLKFKMDMAYASLFVRDDWEFLYEPQNYHFKIIGGTIINGEEAYLIDFKPRKKERFSGRLFVSATSYALIKADYHFNDAKSGVDFSMLGVGYSEDSYSASIYFEKTGTGYFPTYISRTVGNSFKFNRSLSLIKRKDRFLIDKKLAEIKVDLAITVNALESTEILFTDAQNFTAAEYQAIEENKKLEILSIKRFSDDLWKDYNIIEPTKQMKEYSIH